VNNFKANYNKILEVLQTITKKESFFNSSRSFRSKICKEMFDVVINRGYRGSQKTHYYGLKFILYALLMVFLKVLI
jgi:hypothetical protein